MTSPEYITSTISGTAHLLEVSVGGAEMQHVLLMLSLGFVLLSPHAVHQAPPLLHLPPKLPSQKCTCVTAGKNDPVPSMLWLGFVLLRPHAVHRAPPLLHLPPIFPSQALTHAIAEENDHVPCILPPHHKV